VLDKLGAGMTTLWLHVKSLQYFQKETVKTFVLIFNQFEELFSYDKEEIKPFKKQLADLLYAKVPGYISRSVNNRLKEPKCGIHKAEN